MKKFLPLLFVALCLILCLIPSVGMIFSPTTEAIGNERLQDPPSITNEDGSFNLGYFTSLGDYFSKHFAFRAEAITADAKIQSGVFENSNIDTVTVGSDGWLYYSSTLNDYLGRDTLSSREVGDIVHNLKIIRDWCSSKGVDFLFTIAPNKNTLYPENMPYYTSVKAGSIHNRDLVDAALKDSDIKYADMFSLFEAQGEVLYFARDSHWNNKGALLAYDEILKTLGKAHDDYSTAEVSRKKDFIGDLSKMIYPAGAEPEYNYYYGAEDRYSYVTDTKSVEDARISTSNPDATGSLYMYRDSFGNALLPYFAAAYRDATFTKAFPMILEADFETAKPDTFIMELVERNVSWLIERPPVLPSPKMTLFKAPDEAEKTDKDFFVEAKKSMYSANHIEFSGTVDSSLLKDDDIILVSVTDTSGNTAVYECYGLSAEDGKTGFIAYARSEDYPSPGELEISLLTQNGNEFKILASAKANLV